jgi:hypothetical protein
MGKDISMIDDYAKVKELMRQMKAQLPIPARLTYASIRAMRARRVKLPRSQELQIKDVFYIGDEGGIACDVTLSQDSEEALIVSITHLRVDPQHPLATEIRAYQMERVKRITLSGGSSKPSALTIDPKKNKKPGR